MDNWNHGYVVGVLLGDGCLNISISSKATNGHHYNIILRVVSEKFALRFKKALDSLVGKQSRLRCHTRKIKENPNIQMPAYTQRYYSVIMRSKEWFYRLVAIKTQILSGNFNFNSTMLKGIVSGFFDSEGGRYKYHEKYHYIALYNTNHFLLSIIGKILKKIGVLYSGIYSGTRNEYRLAIYRQQEVSKFDIIIGKKFGAET